MRYLVPVLTLSVSALTLSGCSNLKLGTDDVCGTIDALVADYPTGFTSFRGKAQNFPGGPASYRASTEIIDGHCQIWSWGGGESAYLCSATSPSLDQARTRHLNSQAVLQQCLADSGWTESGDWRERNGETDGYASIFRSQQSEAVVSIQTTVQTGGPGKHFTNFLYIGGENRARALNP